MHWVNTTTDCGAFSHTELSHFLWISVVPKVYFWHSLFYLSADLGSPHTHSVIPWSKAAHHYWCLWNAQKAEVHSFSTPTELGVSPCASLWKASSGRRMETSQCYHLSGLSAKIQSKFCWGRNLASEAADAAEFLNKMSLCVGTVKGV